jgi:hypothetical protein
MKPYNSPSIETYIAGLLFIPALMLGWVAILIFVGILAIFLLLENFKNK